MSREKALEPVRQSKLQAKSCETNSYALGSHEHPADEDDEHVVELLNSARKSIGEPTPQKSRGIMSGLYHGLQGIIGGRRETSSITDQAQEPEDLASATPIRSNLGTSAKRKQPPPRANVNDVPENEATSRPPKRPRVEIEAVKPPEAAGASTASPRRSRRHQESTEPEAPNVQRKTSRNGAKGTQGTVNVANHQSPPAKARRGQGRPPKTRQQDAASSSESKDNEMDEIILRPNGQGATGETGQETATAEDDNDPILENPSPVKPILPSREKPKGRLGQQQAPELTHENDKGDDGDSEIGDESIELPAIPAEDAVDQEASAPEPHVDLIDTKLLEKMLEVTNRVGHSLDIDNGKWKLCKKETTIYSTNGKRTVRLLKTLTTAYQNLLVAKDSGKKEVEVKIQGVIPEILNALNAETSQILKDRLGDPAIDIKYLDAKKTKTILTDLYFNIFPKLVQAVMAAAEAYGVGPSMDTSDLQEVIELVEMLHSLADRAVKQRPDLQPKPDDKENKYKIHQPTKDLLPMVRKLRKNLWKELNARIHAERNAERATQRQQQSQRSVDWEKMAPERDRTRRENESREKLEKRRRKRVIHKLQRQCLAKSLHSPVWGHVLVAEIMKEEQKAARKISQTAPMKHRAVQPNNAQELQQVDVEDVDYGPFGDDDGYERVSVFGKNNTHQNSRPKPLSKEDQAEFIDCMRFQQGKSTAHAFGQNYQLIIHRGR